MISAERFLKEQGLQPASADTGGLALSSEDPERTNVQRWNRRTKPDRSSLFAGSENATKTPRHARHAGRVGNGDSTAAKDPNDLDACREAALRLLDAAPRPSGALRERLIGKGYTSEVVDDVIERLTRVQLIDDEAYTNPRCATVRPVLWDVGARSLSLHGKASTVGWPNRFVMRRNPTACLLKPHGN